MIVVGNQPLFGLSADDVRLSTNPMVSPQAAAMNMIMPQEKTRIMTAPAPQVPTAVPAPVMPDLMTDLPVDPYADYVEPSYEDLYVAPAGEKKKCRWWCWLLIAGGVATVGGLSYYAIKR